MKQYVTFISRFFLHPVYLPELFLIFQNRVRDHMGGKKKQIMTLERCKSRAVDTQQALKILFGEATTYTPIIDLYKKDITSATQIQDNCPVKMGGPGDMDLLYYIAENIGATSSIETGVAYGWSSLSILLSLQHRKGHLYSIDMPYPGKKNDTYVGCIVPEYLRKFWTLYQTCDRIGLKKLEKKCQKIDMCHYDSDKTYYGRMANYKKLWYMLREQGIFISDDIADNSAFYDFCISLGKEPIIVGFENKYIGIIVR